MSNEQDKQFQKLIEQFEKIIENADLKIDEENDIQKKYLLTVVPEICQFVRARSLGSDFNASSLMMMCTGYLLFDLISRIGTDVQKRNLTDDQITQVLQSFSFSDLEQFLSSAGLIYWYYANSRR